MMRRLQKSTNVRIISCPAATASTKEEAMGTYAVKRIDEMEAVFRGAFKRARAELGVESFGLQVIDMPPNYENYPEHDHEQDGQEEVYVTLRGEGEIEIAGERFPLDSDHMARVGPGISRKVWPGANGIRLLIVGGVPGGTYEAPDLSKLGEPDPMAA
jgi:mannose-6-phosphate isomerase-like protein (cupin superfamily)